MEEHRGDARTGAGAKKPDSIDPGVSGGLFLAEKRGGGKQGTEISQSEKF